MLNNDRQNAPKMFYKKVQNMRSKKDTYEPTEIINDEHGNILNRPQEIMERWKNYFNQLLNLKEGEVITTINTIEDDLEQYILKSECEDGVKHAQNNKSPGIDSIPIELIKMLTATGINWLHRLFNVIWKTQKTPQE